MNVGLFRNCTEKENFMNTSFMTILLERMNINNRENTIH